MLIWRLSLNPDIHHSKVPSSGITILNQRLIKEDDIQFVTEFPCLLGHPVSCPLLTPLLHAVNGYYGRIANVK